MHKANTRSKVLISPLLFLSALMFPYSLFLTSTTRPLPQLPPTFMIGPEAPHSTQLRYCFSLTCHTLARFAPSLRGHQASYNPPSSSKPNGIQPLVLHMFESDPEHLGNASPLHTTLRRASSGYAKKWQTQKGTLQIKYIEPI